MKGKDFYYDFFKKILNYQKGEEIFTAFLYEKNEITRYSKSKIHQNTSYENLEVAISIKEKDYIVTRFFSNPQLDDAKSLVDRTYDMLKNTYPSDYPGYPEFSTYKEVFTFDEETFNVSEKERALAVYRISKVLGDFEGYGVINTGGSEIALFSSKGLSAYSKISDAHVTITAMKKDATGWAEGHSRRFSQVDLESIAEEAKFKAANSFDKIQVEPGEYTVLLEPEAVADIFTFASYLGFSAKTYQEKRNFLFGKLGQKVFSDKLTVYEDPFFEDGFPFPFDFEGVPKEKIEIISNGVFKNLLYDRKTATLENKKSTGNAAGFPPSTFPLPFNLVISPGDKSKEEILSEIDYGIYVSRFHYTNVVDVTSFSVTGMTRDGTFLIEKGKITKAIKNLRFTDSFLRVLSSDIEISKERKLIAESSPYGFRFSTGVYAPYILCSLRFTSLTYF
ncbi:MAG: TldD/PmbA family protein [Candidatus Hydrothermales bacterium]